MTPAFHGQVQKVCGALRRRIGRMGHPDPSEHLKKIDAIAALSEKEVSHADMRMLATIGDQLDRADRRERAPAREPERPPPAPETKPGNFDEQETALREAAERTGEDDDGTGGHEEG